MEENYDAIIIGAGTAGTYFAKLLAEKGYKILVIDKSAREDLGKRLDIFHIDKELFDRFGIPAPSASDEDYVTEFEYTISKSAFDEFPKRINYPFVVMRLPHFLERLTRWAEKFGVTYEFNTEFVDFIYAGGQISGAILNQNGNTLKVNSRLVADASGISSVGRRKLKDDYGVENFEIGPHEKFYVILRYVKLKNPETDRVTYNITWPYYKTWIAPQLDEDGAIFGVGANFSYEYAEEIYQKFISQVKLPLHEVQYIEKGTTPYRRPPYSFVADGFVALGDSACLTKPYSGEGITSGWVLSKIAAEEFSQAMQYGKYPDTKSVWNTNVRYQRGQGADFAYMMCTLIGAVNSNAKENHYQFKKDIVFNEKDMTDMNRDFAVNLSLGSTISLVFKILIGVITGNISLSTLKALIRAVLTADKLRKHYQNYPKEISSFEAWKQKADTLWESAGTMADAVN